MISREISGKTRHFRFGTYTFKIIREHTGLQFLEDVFNGLANKKNGVDSEGKPAVVPIMSQLEHIDFLSMFLFACAKHAALSLKEDVDFNESQVADWMDEIGYESAMRLVTELIQVYTDGEKNPTAPAMGQPA